jgi:hypothetical protein
MTSTLRLANRPSVVLAIDPGPTHSAWIVTAGDKIVDFGKSQYDHYSDITVEAENAAD